MKVSGSARTNVPPWTTVTVGGGRHGENRATTSTDPGLTGIRQSSEQRISAPTPGATISIRPARILELAAGTGTQMRGKRQVGRTRLSSPQARHPRPQSPPFIENRPVRIRCAAA